MSRPLLDAVAPSPVQKLQPPFEGVDRSHRQPTQLYPLGVIADRTDLAMNWRTCLFHNAMGAISKCEKQPITML